MKRRMRVSGSCGLGSFAALALSGAAFGDFIFFTEPSEFFAAIEAQGIVSNGFWNFNPHNVGRGFAAGRSDPLNYLTAAADRWWDSMPLDNVQFQSNLDPGGEGGPNPRGANGLKFVTAPFLGIKNDAVVVGTVDCFDILSGVPVNADHIAMALNVVDLIGDRVSPIHVTVWDKNEEDSVKLIIAPLGNSDRQFVGILATNDMMIGRVNIYDTGDGAEGISAIEVFVQGGCPWDLDDNGAVGATDLLSLLVTWGACAPCIDCPADFDHNCTVGASDLLALLVNWGPCP